MFEVSLLASRQHCKAAVGVLPERRASKGSCLAFDPATSGHVPVNRCS